MKRIKDSESKGLSRREFIKDAGIIVGGVALTSLVESSGCSKTKTANTTATTKATSSTAVSTTPNMTYTPLSSAATGTAPISPASSSTHPVANTIQSVNSSPPISTSELTLIEVPGCTCKIASDRLYTVYHVWVKNLGDNTVLIGVSDKFQLLTGVIKNCGLSSPGTNITVNDPFGAVSAHKIAADLISPVSGNILDANQSVIQVPQNINADPYGNWMLKIQLSKPSELNDLLSPIYYAYLQASDWTDPVPAEHENP
jgi:glycine cleavage system H protein